MKNKWIQYSDKDGDIFSKSFYYDLRIANIDLPSGHTLSFVIYTNIIGRC